MRNLENDFSLKIIFIESMEIVSLKKVIKLNSSEDIFQNLYTQQTTHKYNFIFLLFGENTVKLCSKLSYSNCIVIVFTFLAMF